MKSIIYRYRIVQLVFSTSLIPIWGLGLLAYGTSSRYTAFVVFLFTILMYQFVPIIKKRDRQSQLILMIGPSIYMIVLFLFLKPLEYILLGSITWIFVVTCISLFVEGGFFKKTVPLTLIAAVYSFVIYPMVGMEHVQYSAGREIVEPNKNKNLGDFSFIDHKLDTFNIESDKPILIETWNETCRPCIKSIKEMQDTLSARAEFKYYYLYQSMNGKRLDTDEVFLFKHIKHKENIIIDIQNILFDSLNLSSFPSFLIFGKKGDLVNYRVGYSSKRRDDILSELFKMIDDAKVQKEPAALKQESINRSQAPF